MTLIRILMDSVPEDIDLDDLVAVMEAVEQVEQVHHVHVWQLDEHHRALEAHVVLDTKHLDQIEAIKESLEAVLATRFNIGHSTLEFETQAVRQHDRGVISPH